MMIQPNWPAPSEIKAFTTCMPLDVTIRKSHHLQAEPAWLKQVHGSNVVTLPGPANQEADALVSRSPGIVCAVLTADCVPILVTACSGLEVAAIHAGWRGLVAGVIEATFLKLHTLPQDCIAWIGPAISQPCFEVGAEVHAAFLKKDPDFDVAFSVNKFGEQGKYQADLPKIAEKILYKIGVRKVYQSGLCTFSDSRFYSYRRDHGKTGRMASLIYINS